MPRLLAFLAALLLSALTVSAACTASAAQTLRFTLESSSDPGKVRASFRRVDRETTNWATDFPIDQLAGLDAGRLRADSNIPVRFAFVREAGRLDCSGDGGHGRASGSCSFTANPDFLRLLESRGIRRPSDDQAFAMMVINVRREIIDALAAARYPTPTADLLVALTAIGVDGRYVTGLADAGYRPDSLDTLLQFRALNITPEYIGGYARIGYDKLPPSALIQLKALGVDADYITSFQRIGYGRLPASALIQLKALGVTPEFALSIQGRRGGLPSVDELVMLRATGGEPRGR